MYAKELNDYRHNFASWTASRAVQRNFTTTPVIKKAIHYAKIHSKVKKLNTSKISQKAFDKWHLKTANALMKSLMKSKVTKGKVTYGRVSKIIAIYIKTIHVIGNPKSRLSNVAHIPVDRILLNKLFIKYKTAAFDTKHSRWTLLSEKDYFEIISELRKIQKMEKLKSFWMLEKYWEIE